MCGIAGIVGTQAESSAVERMIAAQRHRGPDGSGLHLDPSGRCVLGHRRLAILDTSQAGVQPMACPAGRHWLTYNGEVYNFKELRSDLEREGETFATGTDTEVILRLLVRRGTAGLTALRGMFALALWDSAAGTLLLARDAFGIKPLYMADLGPGGLVFASEVRALLASSLVARKLDVAALSQYLELGFVIEPHTIVESVRALAPGSWLVLGAEGRRRSGGTFSEALPSVPERAATSEEMGAAFRAAVRDQLVSDVPIGAFLSGGVDSSAIVGAMTAVEGFQVKTLTVSFPDEPAWDESVRARRWAEACGATHQDVPMTGGDMLRLIPAAVGSQDQPTMDAVNTYAVSKAAREQGLTVVLSGVGGDELFGGYSTVRDVPRAQSLRRRLGGLGALASKMARLGGSRWDARRAKLVDMLEASPDLASLYAVRRHVFTPRQLRCLAPTLESNEAGLALAEAMPDGLDPRDVVSWLEATIYMRSQLLRDTDSMGMACSIEIRPPFLDQAFARRAWEAGPSWRDGKRRFVASLGPGIPADILEEPKRGFTLPFDAWLVGALRDEVHERLHELPAIFDQDAVQALWARFLTKPARVGWSRPWSLFVLATYLAEHGLST